MYTFFDNAKNAIVVKELPGNHDSGNSESNITTVNVNPYHNVTFRDAIIHFLDTHPNNEPIHITMN